MPKISKEGGATNAGAEAEARALENLQDAADAGEVPPERADLEERGADTEPDDAGKTDSEPDDAGTGETKPDAGKVETKTVPAKKAVAPPATKK